MRRRAAAAGLPPLRFALHKHHLAWADGLLPPPRPPSARSLKHKSFSRGDLSTFGAEQEVGPTARRWRLLLPAPPTPMAPTLPPCPCPAPAQLHHEGAEAASDMQKAVDDAVVSAERGAAAHGNLM